MKLSKYKYEIFLFLIFFFALAFRLYFVFQTPYFSDDSAYLTLRQVDYIKEFHRPMFYDDLSYGGKDVVHLDLFPSVMALASFIPYGLKIVPAIFISCIVFIVYLIALQISGDKFNALVASLMSSFVPVLISSTLNNISVFTLILPLFLLMFYCLINIKKKSYLYLFILLSFLMPLLHPIAVFIPLAMVIFYVLAMAENIELSHISREAMVFSIFLIILIEFLLYKGAFLSLGFKFVWQNVPTELLANYFKNLNLLDSILQLGVLPFILGVLGFTLSFFRDKNVGVFSFIAAAFSALILLSFKLVSLPVGLMLLGISLVLGSSISIGKFFRYLKLTKFSRFDYVFKIFLDLLEFFGLCVPSFFSARGVLDNTLSGDEALVLQSVRDETEPDATVLSLFSEGNYISALGERKNVMDSDFLTAPSVNTRYEDVREIYTSVSGVKALQLLGKYNIQYIYFTPTTRKFYNVQNLSYVEDEKCFVEYRKSGEVYLYKVRC